MQSTSPHRMKVLQSRVSRRYRLPEYEQWWCCWRLRSNSRDRFHDRESWSRRPRRSVRCQRCRGCGKRDSSYILLARDWEVGNLGGAYAGVLLPWYEERLPSFPPQAGVFPPDMYAGVRPPSLLAIQAGVRFPPPDIQAGVLLPE